MAHTHTMGRFGLLASSRTTTKPCEPIAQILGHLQVLAKVTNPKVHTWLGTPPIGDCMKVEQIMWQRSEGWAKPDTDIQPTLILVFGEEVGTQNSEIGELCAVYPDACVSGCSTAGEVYGLEVIEESPSLVATLIEFESTSVLSFQSELSAGEESFSAGAKLASQLPQEGLTYVLVLSEGLAVNGSELVRGMLDVLPSEVIVSGGLSADRAHFSETFVLDNENSPSRHIVSCVGFYGSNLQIRCGSYGGWEPFGPLRQITKSTGNVVYEIDGKNALDVYKMYLGEQATELPKTGLNFPFCVYDDVEASGVVRTILGIDKEAGSIIFAGDMPQGMMARLMHANLNRLIGGAAEAAKQCISEPGNEPQLALLISCVGRKLVLRQRVEEEIEAVEEVLGTGTSLAGFYSYGEISTGNEGAFSHLHNQTMTITTFTES